MTIAEKLLTKLSTLSEEEQRKVLEFIESMPPVAPQPRSELYGLFKGFDTTEEEIAEARREMWGNSPGEDY